MVIGGVALVVIGPERLPRVARTAGHLLGRFQRYVADVKADINREMELADLKKLKTSVEEAARSVEQSVKSGIDEAQTHLKEAEGELRSTQAELEKAQEEIKRAADMTMPHMGMARLEPTPRDTVASGEEPAPAAPVLDASATAPDEDPSPQLELGLREEALSQKKQP
jgi:sec-independent protein translocase protein TatB